jgi:hypothetical protein
MRAADAGKRSRMTSRRFAVVLIAAEDDAIATTDTEFLERAGMLDNMAEPGSAR